jgi:hypothetical protein
VNEPLPLAARLPLAQRYFIFWLLFVFVFVNSLVISQTR